MARAQSVPSMEIPKRMCHRHGWVEFLQRSAGGPYSGEIYALHCLGCGNSWKIYQHSYHGENCPRVEKKPFDLKLAKKLIRERKKAVKVFWDKFEEKKRKTAK